MARILIIDDDPLIRSTLTALIEDMGFESEKASTLSEGTAMAREGDFDVVCLDIDLPDGNGLEAVPEISGAPSSPEVIIITGIGDRDSAALAVRNGAWDYIEKPASLEAVRLPLIRALQYRSEKKSPQVKPVALNRDGIVGRSKDIRGCLDLVAQAAGGDANVLITGETGTGKELFARAIHENSPRSSGPFVVVDCSTLTENLVESELFGHERGAFTSAEREHVGMITRAHKGTLFLDEIGELPASVQKAFLRVLQERRFRPVGSSREIESDFRLVVATNRNLEGMGRAGNFRQDLLYRLQTVVIQVPPLRERPDDVRDLALHYMTRICERYGLPPKGFSPEFMDFLVGYDWPGNVRELINTIEGMIVTNQGEPTLYPKHLPQDIRIRGLREHSPDEHVRPASPTADWTEMPNTWKHYKMKCEKAYFRDLMEYSDYDLNEASEVSGLGVHSLYKYLKRNGIPTKRPRLGGG
jgi:two-component system NtrC family response regulator